MAEELMKPPQELLTECLDKCRELQQHQNSVEEFVRCTSLARIVHGGTHWMVGVAHTQLAQQYLRNGLSKQALHHAVKGRDILISASHVTTETTPSKADYNLALAHYIIGVTQTTQKKFKEAQKSLLSADKVISLYQRHQHTDPEESGAALRLDIVTAQGRVWLEDGDHTQARELFQKAVVLCKEIVGEGSGRLVPILRGLACAALREGVGGAPVAVTTLTEALTLAETNYGCESEEAGDILLGLGRAHAASGEVCERVEEWLLRAQAVYRAALGQYHTKTVNCKDELCKYLATQSGSRKKLLPLLEELIADKKQAFGSHSIQVADSLKILGTVQLTQGEVQSAVSSLTKAKTLYSSLLGPKHSQVQNIADSLAIIVGKGEKRTVNKPVFNTTV